MPRTATQIAAAFFVVAFGMSPGAPPAPPKSARLYVFDCGTLHVSDPARFRLTRDQVAQTDLSVPCYLIAHPRGTLMWDVGAVPDADWTPTGAPVRTHLVLTSDKQERDVTVVKTLGAQLADVGYRPSDITYLALSHYHYDHTANANLFSNATWLVRKNERDGMFEAQAPGVTQPATYAALRTSKTRVLTGGEHDVFGDRTVVIKSAPGHTPGHQVLYLRLANTGSVLLSGDLYHYQEERALGRVPTFEFDEQQTRASRADIETFLTKTGAQLWIQHDLTGFARLRKAPDFYQ